MLKAVCRKYLYIAFILSKARVLLETVGRALTALKAFVPAALYIGNEGNILESSLYIPAFVYRYVSVLAGVELELYLSEYLIKAFLTFVGDNVLVTDKLCGVLIVFNCCVKCLGLLVVGVSDKDRGTVVFFLKRA